MRSLDDYTRTGRESQKLELKSSEAVADPRILPRAVCAFLNADGGEVIVGVREVPGGLDVDPIEDPERARQIVLDRLLSTIDPTPPSSLKVEVLEGSAGRGLRISVPRGDVVYALREKRGALSFVQRRQDRVLPMSWPEVQALLASRNVQEGGRAREDDPEQRIRKTLGDWKDLCHQKAPELKKVGGLFLVASVLPPPDRPPRDWERKLNDWYQDPTLIGLRRFGYHFLQRNSPPKTVRGRKGNRGSGRWESGYKMAEYTRTAGLNLAHRLDRLPGTPGSVPPTTNRVLHQLALVEMISSFARVFGALWRDSDEESVGAHAWSAVVITGAEHLQLPPYAHDTYGSLFDHDWQPAWEDDELGPFIARVDLAELRENPDQLAWQLLRALYLDFGYEEETIPYFDRDRGRFRFE